MKVGDLTVVLPEDIAGDFDPREPDDVVVCEHPENPDPLDETPDILSTTDPFQYHVAEAQAETNIGNVDKPWVRKTWFFLNIILPSVMLIGFSIYALFFAKESERWVSLGFFLIVCVPIIAFSARLWDKGNTR